METNLTLISFVEHLRKYTSLLSLSFEYKITKEKVIKKVNLRSCSEELEDYWKLMSIYNSDGIKTVMDNIKNENMIVRKVEVLVPKGTIKLESIPFGIEYEFFHKFMVNHVLPTHGTSNIEYVEFDSRSIRRYNSYNVKPLTENKNRYENNNYNRKHDFTSVLNGLRGKFETVSLPF